LGAIELRQYQKSEAYSPLQPAAAAGGLAEELAPTAPTVDPAHSAGPVEAPLLAPGAGDAPVPPPGAGRDSISALSSYADLGTALDGRTHEILERRRRTSIVRRRGWLVRRMLLVADLLGLAVAFVVARALFPVSDTITDQVNPAAEVLLFLLTLPIWVVVAKLYGLYDRDEERTDHTTTDDIVGVFHLVTVGTWIVFAGIWLSRIGTPDISRILTFWLAAILAITLARSLARAFCRRRIAYLQNTVILGAGDVGQMIARKLIQHPEYGINLVGFVDDTPKERGEDLEHLSLLGSREQLPTLVRLFDIERVVIAFSNDTHNEILSLMRSLKDLDVQIDIVPRLFEIVSPGVSIHTIEGVPLVGLPPLRLSHSSRLMKRTTDYVLSSIGLFLLAPVFAAITAAIKLDSPGPVFFRQIRIGIGGKAFYIYKFRTMVADADERKHEVAHLNMHAGPNGDTRMFKAPSDPRITRVGAILRRYSLDELPQLINVWRGEMSLVGPRPLILEEDRHVADWARKRLSSKPGMTGLWQVLGRSEIGFEEMTRLDYLYVTNWSLWGDLQLLIRTVPAVLRSRRAY
jgi:exopolysaccharide biosynthesis polyprenyl glycosylphosphotransferase